MNEQRKGLYYNPKYSLGPSTSVSADSSIQTYLQHLRLSSPSNRNTDLLVPFGVRQS